MDYNTTLDYISSFINFEKMPQYNYSSSFNLERMYTFLQELRNPHLQLKTIHIAGSKGKGSTCAIISYLLRQAGYKVGLYTSPHLLDVRERIRILTQDRKGDGSIFPFFPQVSLKNRTVPFSLLDFEGTIRKKEFVELIEKIRPAAEKFRDHKKLGKLSFFEVLTACAFLYFREKEVDFAVLETGLGGRLDATNVTESVACGIANISLEHTDKLGNSLDSIAREKAGIVKIQNLVVSAPQEKESMDVIKEVCQEKNARLYEIGKDITCSITDSNENFQIFDIDGPGYSYKNLRLNLIGAHQVENAALAIAIVESCIKIEEDVLRSSLENISWAGRLQVIQKSPYVILDGAQNVASIRAILSSIKKIFRHNRLICIFGISSDKDINGISKELDGISDTVILTKSMSDRAKEPLALKENFFRSSLKITGNVREAFDLGLRITRREDLLLVTGSLYVVGEVMAWVRLASTKSSAGNISGKALPYQRKA